MKELPILFSGPMVRAILDGRKTQTRRPVKGSALDWLNSVNFTPEYVALPANEFSPYGYASGCLWVRETHVAFGRWETRFSEKKGRDEWHFVDMTQETGREYRFEGALPNAARGGATPTWWRRPSIFMPRAAARTLLEVTKVRIERLQDISETDARAEGVEFGRITDPITGEKDRDAVEAYEELWDSLNAARGYSWDANPYVWVVEFNNSRAAALDRMAENAKALGLYNTEYKV